MLLKISHDVGGLEVRKIQQQESRMMTSRGDNFKDLILTISHEVAGLKVRQIQQHEARLVTSRLSC